MKPVYLDHNATTPVIKPVLDAMQPFFEQQFGNPSSSHWLGIEARDAVEASRKHVADLINATPEEIIFTSCATESNNLAIQGVSLSKLAMGGHIVTSAVEHASVLEVCRYCETMGFQLTVVPVDTFGRVDPEDIQKAIRPETILISVMHANNETGTIQPVEDIGRLAHEKDVLFHVDAAQSVGKIPVDVQAIQADFLTVAGHKFYGPKGIGALYIRREAGLKKILHGAGHEKGLRPGTENVPAIIGLGAACRIAHETLHERMQHLRKYRDMLHQGIMHIYPEARLNGPEDNRLPNTLNIGFKGLTATDLLNEMPYLCVSPGAACHSGSKVILSAVLTAMQVPEEYALGSLRFSTGITTSHADIEQALDMIKDAVSHLRG